MRSAESAVLCDAIEIGALQFKKALSVDDIIAQAFHGVLKEEARRLVREALSLAVLRAQCCPSAYPFDVSVNYIQPKPQKGFDPYLFMLYGYALKRTSVVGGDKLSRRFDRYFEDFLAWSLERFGFTSRVLSEPREERGLPKSLKVALAELSACFGEATTIDHQKIKPADNDLDVDVVASPAVIDKMRCGGPFILIQCTTRPVEQLKMKMTEGFNLFSSVWRNGFFLATSIRGGATPEDLLTIHSLDWIRLNQLGWTLDRMRIAELFHARDAQQIMAPKTVVSLWKDLNRTLPEFDWRNDWR